MATEAQRRSVRRYDDKSTKQVKLKFNLRTDRDILDKLDDVPNKQGYIKGLIRRDISSEDSE